MGQAAIRRGDTLAFMVFRFTGRGPLKRVHAVFVKLYSGIVV